MIKHWYAWCHEKEKHYTCESEAKRMAIQYIYAIYGVDEYWEYRPLSNKDRGPGLIGWP